MVAVLELDRVVVTVVVLSGPERDVIHVRSLQPLIFFNLHLLLNRLCVSEQVFPGGGRGRG